MKIARQKFFKGQIQSVKPGRGFTLIELLVVIAIIAILGRFVVAGLVWCESPSQANGVFEQPETNQSGRPYVCRGQWRYVA